MKKFIAFLVIIIIAVVLWQNWGTVNAPTVTDDNLPVATSTTAKLYTVDELATGTLPAGDYDVLGYVVKTYTCPACPAGAQCKPCMKDNITIADNPGEKDANKTLIIFATEPKNFTVGTAYSFSVRLTDTNTTGLLINDLELLGAMPVE
ncbi:MAG: hypothetical protein NTY66_03720 [Candidatus Vogelbacteria bacterium]|nr:hypothetical protein [Candidatus Vogelbacteria bacterium]